MKQFYKDTINKLFVDKEYFSSIFRVHEVLLERKRNKEHALLKLVFKGVLAFSGIALLCGFIFSSMGIAGLTVGYSFIVFTLVGLNLETKQPFEKEALLKLRKDFAKDIAENPVLLKDIHQLCIDKEGVFKFNYLIDKIRHGKQPIESLDIVYSMIDNYELHQQVLKEEPLRELFLKQLKIKEDIPEKSKNLPKDKFMEML